MTPVAAACAPSPLRALALFALLAGAAAQAQEPTLTLPTLTLPAPAAAIDAVVRQPRPFGYTVGDIALQEVLLARDGRGFQPASLPPPARVNAWLERRAARVRSGEDGARWLLVEYQVVNAPRALATIAVPGWELAGAAGAPALRVAPAVLGVGPLAPPPREGEALSLRPDRPAPAIDTGAIQRRLVLWLAALAACLAAWLGYAGWSGWHARTHLPFTRALRQVRARGSDPAAAHRALHQAFDRTAGQIVHAGSLDALFRRAPWLQPLRPPIERFYAQSAELFFGTGLPGEALSPQALCRDLSRLERRHAP
jgi:mxaA protein